MLNTTGNIGSDVQDSSSTTVQTTHIVGLNSAQLEAVEHDPNVPLQILAGPGSGKTKVLTSRIARLIITHGLEPSSICAVTFTNKAANEMQERLTKLIGKTRTTAVQMGTFHSLCARYLRKYSAVVKLDTNFTICDSGDSKKLLSALIKPYADYMATNNIVLTEGGAMSAISQAKAKGKTAVMFYEEMEEKDSLERKKKPNQGGAHEIKSMQRILGEVYIGYERILRNNNALDFDDLLIYGVKLFSGHQEAVLWCAHILVDEFQDTNNMQYELMKAIAIRRCVTIVGDPDQSIYGWRSAEIINLSRMRTDFPNTHQIFLEENYRSTGAILRSSLGIVSEDKKRIPKMLHTSHPLGATPFVGKFTNQKEETTFIAREIKRCVANMGGVLRWNDFVILLRYNALSRPIESALQLVGIPCKILGGHRFFERMEVKDLLSYLQLLDNPSFNPAFVRAANVPARGMGDKTMSQLDAQAQKLNISQLELLEKIYDNKVPDIKPPIKKKIGGFVKAIRALRKLVEERSSPCDIIRKLVELVNYEEYLKKTYQDWDTRWENVQELITFATEVEAEAAKRNAQNHSDETNGFSVLRDFLQASCLSSEGDSDIDESNDKVTISTCHAAKGLEWPVVMIPSVDGDTFPFYRTTDIDEERRLLYVACTRAQSLLYLMYSMERTLGGKTKNKQLSTFVSSVQTKNPGYFSMEVPRFTPADRGIVSTVLSRPLPDPAEVDRRLAELQKDEDLLPTSINSFGSIEIRSLTGEKYSDGIPNLDHLYVNPQALAAISAKFQKDYKKVPFGQKQQKNSSHLVDNSGGLHQNQNIPVIPMGFSSAAVALKMKMEASDDTPPNELTHPTSSKSTSSETPPYTSPTGNQTNLSKLKSEPRSRASSFSKGIVGLDGNNNSKSKDSWTTNVHVSKLRTLKDFNSKASPLNSSEYDEMKPPGESSSATVPPSELLGLTEKDYKEDLGTDYDMDVKVEGITIKSDSRGFMNKANSRPTLGPRLYSTSDTIIGTSSKKVKSCHEKMLNSAAPKTTLNVWATNPTTTGMALTSALHPPPTIPETHSSSAEPGTAVTPTVGVKRRLGMGRPVTSGYTNKKFKRPV